MIGAYHGLSLVSRIVQCRTWHWCSHVSWIEPSVVRRTSSTDDVPLGDVYEAWHVGGVRMSITYHKGHTPGTVIILYDVQLTKKEHEELLAFLRCQIGKKYDYRGVLKFISRRSPNAAAQARWFCSELLFAAFNKICKSLLLRVPAWKVSPGMVVMSPLLRPVGHVIVRPDLASPRRLRKARAFIAAHGLSGPTAPEGVQDPKPGGDRQNAMACTRFAKGIQPPVQPVFRAVPQGVAA